MHANLPQRDRHAHPPCHEPVVRPFESRKWDDGYSRNGKSLQLHHGALKWVSWGQNNQASRPCQSRKRERRTCRDQKNKKIPGDCKSRIVLLDKASNALSDQRLRYFVIGWEAGQAYTAARIQMVAPGLRILVSTKRVAKALPGHGLIDAIPGSPKRFE